MISDLEQLLASVWAPASLLVPSRPLAHPIRAGGSWLDFWDGSYSPSGAGIGVTIGRTKDLPLVHVGVPVVCTDATRTKALSPAFSALLLTSWFTMSMVSFFGDS